jgi:hypothetical protein
MKAQTSAPRKDTVPMSTLAPNIERELRSPSRELPAHTAEFAAGLPDADLDERLNPIRRDADVADEPAASQPSLDERVAERAYFLYLARNDSDGDALSDWLEAERQITEEQTIYG